MIRERYSCFNDCFNLLNQIVPCGNSHVQCSEHLLDLDFRRHYRMDRYILLHSENKVRKQDYQACYCGRADAGMKPAQMLRSGSVALLVVTLFTFFFNAVSE